MNNPLKKIVLRIYITLWPLTGSNYEEACDQNCNPRPNMHPNSLPVQGQTDDQYESWGFLENAAGERLTTVLKPCQSYF